MNESARSTYIPHNHDRCPWKTINGTYFPKAFRTVDVRTREARQLCATFLVRPWFLPGESFPPPTFPCVLMTWVQTATDSHPHALLPVSEGLRSVRSQANLSLPRGKRVEHFSKKGKHFRASRARTAGPLGPSFRGDGGLGHGKTHCQGAALECRV